MRHVLLRINAEPGWMLRAKLGRLWSIDKNK